MFKKIPSSNFSFELKQARIVFESDNIELASHILDKIPESKRKDGWYLLRAECYISKKDWYSAIFCFKSVDTLISVKYQDLLLQAYCNVRQFENAIRHYYKYHKTILRTQQRAIHFAKLARKTNNEQLTLDSLDFIVRKFPNNMDLNIQLIEHFISIQHPNTFPLLIGLFSTTPYQEKNHILYIKWAIQNQHFFYAHMNLLHLLYNNPMFLSASHEMVRLFASMNYHLIAELTVKQMLFRHDYSNNVIQKAENLKKEFPFLGANDSGHLKVSLYPELNYYFAMLNSRMHACYLVGSAVHHLIDFAPLKENQDIDFVVDFNPRLYYPFHQSINKPNLFSADIPDSNFVIRTIDCFYINSERYPSLNMLVKNRDFTINALLCDDRGNILDPTNMGIQDYQHKILRTIQSARQSLEEDPVRILRALKYLIQGYQPTDELQYALIHWQAPREVNISQMIAMARKIFLSTPSKDEFIYYLKNLGLHFKIFGIDYHADVCQIESEFERMFFSSSHSFRC
ncbi:MAG: CCA tRNA nucleotidyltransferase [Gammaproteobacteria bacterium]|nr:CCA tRNA nucleotidyltransferase [Gammaproteobacteria bacterium]